MILACIIIALTILIGISSYFKWKYSYWKRRNIESLQPTFPWGDMENPFRRNCSIGLLMQKYYREFKSRGCAHGGIYNIFSPVYMPIAPESVKNIMQADFEHFVDRGVYYNKRDDPLSAHLFAIGGLEWRNLRTKLTPTFTSCRMKTMFETLLKCSDQLKEAIDTYCETNEPIDIKEQVARYSTDIIGSCAFGLDCNSFKDPHAEFRWHGKNFIRPHSLLKAFGLIVGNAKPELGHLMRFKMFPQESTGFFFKVIEEIVKFREKSGFSRNDMLQLLIEMKNKQDGNSVTLEEIAAQAMVFFLAGFETTSTTTTYCMFELAQNQQIQSRVRREIVTVLDKHQGNITYDSLKEMIYLQQVIDETMRKYPPLPTLNRRCVKDYRLPNTDIVIEKGTLLFLPILGLHHDEEYFPHPQKFDPERFSNENRKNIRSFTYLPFGGGPRMCIGLRFGLMQVKLALIRLLKDYSFTLSDRTQLPLIMSGFTMTLTNEGDIWLNPTKLIS